MNKLNVNKIIPLTGINRNDFLILLFISALLQIAFIFSIPLGFECDAGMFYSYAKGLIHLHGGSISSFRPFIYPLFLLFTGFIFPGTFIITIIVQGAMGIIIPLIVYKILYNGGRFFALLGSVLIVLSCISFVGAKLVLAEQVYAFILILSILFFVKYIEYFNTRDLYIYISLTLIATLTRLEGQVPSAIGILILLLISYYKTKKLKQVFAGLGLAICILGGYSFVRAVYLHDLNQFGTLQTGTGAQFYNRFYGGFEPERMISKENNQLISIKNGSATREFRDQLRTAIIKYPELYRGMRDGLSKMIVEKEAPRDTYDELFGRFEGNPEALLDSILNSDRNLRTIQYSFYVPEALARVMGRKKADRLLLSVAFEAIVAHPEILNSLVPQAFTLIGLNLAPILNLNNSKFEIRNIFPAILLANPGIFDYARTGFNAGNCAKDLLPNRMWREYEFDLAVTSTKFSEVMINIASIGRNYVRLGCGIVVIVLSPFIFYSKRKPLNIFLFMSILFLIAIIGLSSSGGNSKYDIAFMPLLILLAVSLISNFIDFSKKIISNKYGR